MDPVFYIEKAATLRYLFAFPGARVFISGVDKLSDSKDVALLLKNGVDNCGWVPLNQQQINDAREIDYNLLALEQALEALLVADAVDVDEHVEALRYFTTRLSVARSVCHDEGVHAVVTTVLGVVRAARSPRVEDHDAVADADHGRVVAAVLGATRAVVTAVLGAARTARQPRVDGHDAVADLARPPRVDAMADLARQPRADGHDAMTDLARAALGEVRAARARPVLLSDDSVPLQVSSVQAAEALFRAGSPYTRGVWSTARVLDVRGLAQLSDAGDFDYYLTRCSHLGWRIPLLTKVAMIRRLDCLLIFLNHKLKCAFNRNVVRDDGTVDHPVLMSIGEQTEQILRVCMDEIQIFQAEISTIPDAISKLLTAVKSCETPAQAELVRNSAGQAIVIVRSIRAQQVKF